MTTQRREPDTARAWRDRILGTIGSSAPPSLACQETTASSTAAHRTCLPAVQGDFPAPLHPLVRLPAQPPRPPAGAPTAAQLLLEPEPRPGRTTGQGMAEIPATAVQAAYRRAPTALRCGITLELGAAIRDTAPRTRRRGRSLAQVRPDQRAARDNPVLPDRRAGRGPLAALAVPTARGRAAAPIPGPDTGPGRKRALGQDLARALAQVADPARPLATAIRPRARGLALAAPRVRPRARWAPRGRVPDQGRVPERDRWAPDRWAPDRWAAPGRLAVATVPAAATVLAGRRPRVSRRAGHDSGQAPTRGR